MSSIKHSSDVKHVIKPLYTLVPFQAVRNLQPLVCRIHFMDGKTKAVSVEPCDNVMDILWKVQQKINLQNLHGWSLYEVTDQI